MMKSTMHYLIIGAGLALSAAACGSRSSTDTQGTDQQGSSYPGQTNVTSMPCETVSGSCQAPQDCNVGAGVLGADKYICGGSRRVCCLPSCGGNPETIECCN